ncbi:MAG TPA: hypothetical protein VEA77_06165 [Hyphomicrobium sp.]|nr:hypothetical protein [Hyphomicrobium sp.]
MSIPKLRSGAIAFAAILLGGTTIAAHAAPLPSANTKAAADTASSAVHSVRHRGWGGVGIYIGPSYGGYYDGYYGYPRYRSYGYRYSDAYYDRPYRYHNRRWARERFRHPLGRR